MICFAAFLAGKVQRFSAMSAVGVLIEHLAAAALIDSPYLAFLFQIGKIAVYGADADSFAAEIGFDLLSRKLFVGVSR